MGRLRSNQRHREVMVMRFCFKKLGLPVIGEIKAPGYLEGGDFFPCGQDLAMVGIGLRSNIEACQQLMDGDLLGARRFAVVQDKFDVQQDRMHLDCVFSIISDSLCIMLEDIIGEQSPIRRLVDEYIRSPDTGKYQLARSNVELSEFIKGEGYEIIPIKHQDQLEYACNVLNLGNSRIISVHPGSARQVVKYPGFKVGPRCWQSRCLHS
jgi:arginine deiminase